jgi:hypothetical protein
MSAEEIRAAAAAVVPSWDEEGQYLLLPLPSALADVISSIRLEIGGIMLPPTFTEHWHAVRCGRGIPAPYCIKGVHRDVKPWIYGAQLLPCSTHPQDSQWQLALRVQWPPAPDPCGKVGEGY